MAEQREGRDQVDERFNEVFQPDTMLPTQFFGQLKRKRFPSGEHKLLCAVIGDAVDCFQKHMFSHDPKRRQLYIDAEAWIADDEKHDTYSFNGICDTLGLDSEWMRDGLLTWRDRALREWRQRTLGALRAADDLARLQATIEAPPVGDAAGEVVGEAVAVSR